MTMINKNYFQNSNKTFPFVRMLNNIFIIIIVRFNRFGELCSFFFFFIFRAPFQASEGISLVKLG